LSLIAEKFICLTSYREPKEFKPNKSGSIAEVDRAYTVETCRQLRDVIQKQLKKNDATTKLTSPEFAYYQTVYCLISLVLFCLKVDSPKSAHRAVHITDHCGALSRLLKEQTLALVSLPESTPETIVILSSFASLHDMGMLRESIVVIQLTTSFLEKTFAASKINAPKWVVDDLKKVNTATTETISIIKQRIKVLNEAANRSGWLDSICEAAFGGVADGSIAVGEDPDDPMDGDLEIMIFKAIGQQTGLEHTVGLMKDSWQEVAKGWSLVKLD
jgi:N-terminal acetyltransferase B complex non-catalytic subunit